MRWMGQENKSDPNKCPNEDINMSQELRAKMQAQKSSTVPHAIARIVPFKPMLLPYSFKSYTDIGSL